MKRPNNRTTLHDPLKSYRTGSLEKTILALPTIIVAIIMGGSVLHVAGEGIVSTLSTTILSRGTDANPIDWFKPFGIGDENFDASSHSKNPVSDVGLILGPNDGIISEHSLILGEKPDVLDEDDLILGPPLPGSENYAKKTVIARLGGKSKYRSLEGDMYKAKQAAAKSLLSQGIEMDKLDVIGIIDYTKPSYVRRFSIYHPKRDRESRHLVSHGKHTGWIYAKNFSNWVGSLQSSPGLFWVGNHYYGKHGKSIRLHGMEPGINDNAYRRAIVMHSAWYVSYQTMLSNFYREGYPRIGCSHGCPAVPLTDMLRVLKQLKEGTYLYIYNGQDA